MAKPAVQRIPDAEQRLVGHAENRLAAGVGRHQQTLLAISGGGIAWWQRGEANRNAAVAEQNAEDALRNEARMLAALANIEADTGSRVTAIRVALTVVPEHLAKPPLIYAREAEGALIHALQQLREFAPHQP